MVAGESGAEVPLPVWVGVDWEKGGTGGRVGVAGGGAFSLSADCVSWLDNGSILAIVSVIGDGGSGGGVVGMGNSL